MSSPPSPDLDPPPPSHVPNEWEVLSMSTMSASSLGPPLQQPFESGHLDVRPGNGTDFGPSEDIPPHVDDLPEQSFFVAQRQVQEASEVPPPDRSPVDVGFPYSNPRKDSVTSWWKQTAAVFRLQWGETAKPSTVWSIALLAAFVGVVAIGYRWRHERNQCQQLRLELIAKDEKLNDLTYQVSRLKEAMTGRRRGGFSRSSFF